MFLHILETFIKIPQDLLYGPWTLESSSLPLFEFITKQLYENNSEQILFSLQKLFLFKLYIYIFIRRVVLSAKLTELSSSTH